MSSPLVQIQHAVHSGMLMLSFTGDRHVLASHISLTSLTYDGYLHIIKDHILDIAAVKRHWEDSDRFSNNAKSMIWPGGLFMDK